MSMSVRFLQPPHICAVCGRDVDPDGCLIVTETEDVKVQSTIHGLEQRFDVTVGEKLVICRECQQE